MRSVQGRILGIIMALIIALPALFPMVGAGALSSPEYVIMPPGDFNLSRSYTGHFDVYYDSLRIVDAGDAIIGAEGAYNTVANFYGPYGSTIRVILAANHQQYASLLYNYLSGENISEDNVASGWGEGERATIVIEAPDQIPDFQATLAHELSLIAMRTSLIGNKDSVPVWFSEGLAIYVSGDLSDAAKATVGEACRDGKAMTVAQIEDVFQHSADPAVSTDEVSMARAQSGMLMGYFAEQYGNDTIKFIMQDFATTGDLDKAFVKRTGYTPEDVNAAWEASLKGQPGANGVPALSQQVRGYVLDTGGKPVDNETIAFTSMSNDSSMFGKTYSAMTNGSGYYKLSLADGPFSIHLDRPGYKDFNSNITLQKDEVRPYNVTLEKAVAPTQNALASPPVTGDQATYIVLGILNAVAIILIVFVFWRAKK